MNAGTVSFCVLVSLPLGAVPAGLALGIVDGRFPALLAGPLAAAWLAALGYLLVRFRGALRAFVAASEAERGEG